MEEKLLSDIQEADMLLIGIGEEFEEKFDLSHMNNEYQSCFSYIKEYENRKDIIKLPDPKLTDLLNPEIALLKDYVKSDYIYHQTDNLSIKAYQVLEKLIKDKNYFIVSLCKDNYIERTEIRMDRVVSPCGSYLFMQCGENCEENVYDASIYVKDEMHLLKKGNIDEIDLPKCKKCGKNMIFNNINASNYNENGYMKQWEIYTKWLQGTLNKKICILELGVSVQYPTVIRWPFEKIAFLNQKASFYRINKNLSQISAELLDKGSAIAESAPEYLVKKLSYK